MDWKKAKSILIAMFLIINIFLSYQLYTINRSQYIYINKEELETVKQSITKKNIRLEAEIPDRVLIAPSLRVKFFEFDAKKVEGIFLKTDNYSLNKTDRGFEVKDNNISVEVKDKIHMTYLNKNIIIRQTSINEDKCLDIANKFIYDLKLNYNNQYVKTKEVQKGYVRLVYGQQYDEMPVEGSQIEIIATEEGVASAKISWFEWIKTDQRNSIITPVMALLKACEIYKEKGETTVIKQIRQGYSFIPDAKLDPNNEIIVEGSVSPMWIVTSDKTEIFINAYNEKVEKIK